ncbi:hypothetical protein [Flavobacterium litorale]|uniref:Lipocalin-like domain-containing protein n=1 Tax=Flavobacterium litorale TaxID=2856519 RepID=A0ABX8V680_9FLAO|nr:hypothetical protein [Flavobacterium litorale]QYJ68341.1 hypothetical protein K1I41_00170 [Flavobacterium litorale]
MKKYALLLLAIVIVSCNSSISDEDIAYLNGYWEIEKAITPDGVEKEYKVNATVDYFEVEENKGIRKKVMPQLDGTYRVNDTAEAIAIVREDDKTYIAYKTNYSEWKEQIIELDKEHMVIKNEQDIEYHYKKSVPFGSK